MSLVVTGNVKISTSTSETLNLGIGSGTFTEAAASTATFTNGTGSGKIAEKFSITKAAAAAPDVYTLSAITDGIGRSIAFAIVRAIVLINNSIVDGQNLLLAAGATHPFVGPFDDSTGSIKVGPSGCCVLTTPLATGYAVASGSADQIKIDPASNTINYTLLILGE